MYQALAEMGFGRGIKLYVVVVQSIIKADERSASASMLLRERSLSFEFDWSILSIAEVHAFESIKYQIYSNYRSIKKKFLVTSFVKFCGFQRPVTSRG